MAIPSVANQISQHDSDNWAEARSVLKKASSHLYCLKWLDLSGCASWSAALTPDQSSVLSVDLEFVPHSTGTTRPVSQSLWNGPWRGIEYIRLTVNWIPKAFTEVGLLELTEDDISMIKRADDGPRVASILQIRPPAATDIEAQPQTFDPGSPIGRTWARSTRSSAGNINSGNPNLNDVITQTWDPEQEQEIYYQKQEVSAYIADVKHLKNVSEKIQTVRKEAKGKFVNFDLGY
ncbi:putative tafazzin [Phaeomoniella chlamydospora]|uniref:Putative tafazzin n=1 Tax=Phaeomoniella chlamydospora TaxID=158046 RepID=A0A0G2DWY9_PHACM|nr:putative tafazzin [Phaeomoniella chlamydospora]